MSSMNSQRWACRQLPGYGHNPVVVCEREDMGKRITKLEAEVERLTDLASYARHDDGCNGPFNMRCKCGYLIAWRAVHDNAAK